MTFAQTPYNQSMKPILRALLFVSCFTGTSQFLNAQEAEGEAKKAAEPFGRFVSVTSPISDQTVSLINNTAVELQAQSVRESRPAILVLEIESGSSRFGQVRDIASFLTSAEVSNVRTVAWIPKTVEGNHAVLALACHEIIMHPDASLGDISRGQPLEQSDEAFILALADRRRNNRLSRGIISAMLNPSVALRRISMTDETGTKSQKFVTVEELRLLQQQNLEISDVETVKEAGSPGLFNSTDAMKSGFLVGRTVKTRPELTEALGLPREAMRQQADGKPVKSRLIEVHGVIGHTLQDFVLREIRTAVADNVNLLILEIDSPGGSKDIAEEISMTLADLDPSKITTVAWIPRGAWSGGALIAFGCDQIMMHADAQIGDIGVIMQTQPGGAFERAPEKIVSPFLEFVASIAKRKNRAPGLLQAMVDKDLEIFEVTNKKDGRVTWMSEHEIQAQPDEWIKGPMVPESRKGVLLTLRGERAHQLRLAEAPCADMSELRRRLGIPESVQLTAVQRTWVDGIVAFLNSGFGGFLLLSAAIICLYVEAHVPTGAFAVPALICFVLFFWSRFLGGTAGMLELILFALGMGLLALEIFVIPGFGVFGITGILMILLSLVMASHTFAGMNATESFEESMGSLGSLTGAMVTVIVTAVVLNRFLPSIPWVNRLILTPPGYAAAGTGPLLNPSLTTGGDSGPVDMGTVGTAASALRPSGKGMFGDKYIDVVSDGAYIDHGSAIEVIRIAGNRVIVRAVQKSEPRSETIS